MVICKIPSAICSGDYETNKRTVHYSKSKEIKKWIEGKNGDFMFIFLSKNRAWLNLIE